MTTATNAAPAITINRISPVVPVWTVSRADYWKAIASIRQREDGLFDVVPTEAPRFPEAVEMAMDSFSTFDAAENWIRETAARLWG